MLRLKGLPVAELLCAGEAPGDPAVPSLQEAAVARPGPGACGASSSVPWARGPGKAAMYQNILGKQEMECAPLGNSQSNPHCSVLVLFLLCVTFGVC